MAENIEDRTWFETRNGRTYAYVSKKILDQRTGRFRTQREYVGTVDPETGRIIPAKKRIPIQTTRTDISAPSLGDVLIHHGQNACKRF